MIQKKSFLQGVLFGVGLILFIASGIALYRWQLTEQSPFTDVNKKEITKLQQELTDLKKNISAKNNILTNDLALLEQEVRNFKDYIIKTIEKTQEIPPENELTKELSYPLEVTGYYTRQLREAWGEEQYCDMLTLTDGNIVFTHYILGRIHGGNTVHSKNKLNQPIIKFSMDDLSPSEQELFKSSTYDNPVTLLIDDKFKEGADRGMGVCESAYIILDISS